MVEVDSEMGCGCRAPQLRCGVCYLNFFWIIPAALHVQCRRSFRGFASSSLGDEASLTLQRERFAVPRLDLHTFLGCQRFIRCTHANIVSKAINLSTPKQGALYQQLRRSSSCFEGTSRSPRQEACRMPPRLDGKTLSGWKPGGAAIGQGLDVR